MADASYTPPLFITDGSGTRPPSDPQQQHDGNGDAPRCRMCPRPARWVVTREGVGEWGMYCAGRSCSNRERICQQCEQLFTMNVNGSGTKYCSTECKTAGYHPHKVGTRVIECAWCRQPRETSSRTKAKAWPFVCHDCLAPLGPVLQRLRAHHVPHQRAQQLLDDPHCEVCGIDVVTPTPDPFTKRTRALLVVDHDHRCCPAGHYSCSECVRGLVCNHCNTAAGMLRDDPALATALAEYLSRPVR